MNVLHMSSDMKVRMQVISSIKSVPSFSMLLGPGECLQYTGGDVFPISVG